MRAEIESKLDDLRGELEELEGMDIDDVVSMGLEDWEDRVACIESEIEELEAALG